MQNSMASPTAIIPAYKTAHQRKNLGTKRSASTLPNQHEEPYPPAYDHFASNGNLNGRLICPGKDVSMPITLRTGMHTMASMSDNQA